MRIRNASLILLSTVLLSSTTAWADAAGAAKPGMPINQFVIMGLFFVLMYFMIIRPQSKRAKEHRNLIAAIAKDDEVVTNGGLVGRVTKVTDHFLHVEIAQGVEVVVQRAMIASSLPKGTLKSA